MNRLLVIGAGASIEECKRSGNYPNDPDRCFPAMRNFCNKLFNPTSGVLLQVTSSYLKSHGIAFDPKLLNLKEGDSFTGDDMSRSPIGVFLKLEAEMPERHNIERLCEYAWQSIKLSPKLWDALIYDGIYFKLFALFTEQFGLGLGKSMFAGIKVANQLTPWDVVLNLNYDIVFDLALKQAGKKFCYAPDRCFGSISVLKPHGSINLYVNLENGNFFFEEPDLIPGSVSFPDPKGGLFSPHSGILPPRLNKDYDHHPIAKIILTSSHYYAPRSLTFWGVGLTDSDIELIALYRAAANTARIIEFINPCLKAYETAVKLLGKNIIHFPTLDEWVEKHSVT